MSKRILLIGGNFFPELTGIGKYNGEMIRWFAQKGFECTVIATAPYYPQWQVMQPYTNKWFSKEMIKTEGRDIEVYRCPHYVPSTPSGKKRLLSEVSFSITSLVPLLRILAKKKYDYVLTVAPPFQLGFHALLYKVFRKAKFLYHIQDLQIEAARDLNMIKSKSLLSLLFSLEKRILRRSDLISSISAGMQKKITLKTRKRTVFFPNWVSTHQFHPLPDKEALKQSFGFSPQDKVILYSGAIGEKQGLEMIINCARELKQKKDIRFVICGTGPYKEKLSCVASELGLTNVHFMPLQPIEQFNAFLNMADLHLVMQKGNAGDLMMPSKLTTILAVGGLSLVTASPGTSLYETVSEHNIGLLVEPESQEAFTDAITAAVESDFSAIRENARMYAQQYLSIDQVLSKYVDDIEQVGKKKKVVGITRWMIQFNKQQQPEFVKNAS